VIAQENARLTPGTRRLTTNFMASNRLTGIDHTLKHGDDLVRDIREHLVYCVTDVFFTGFAVDLAQSPVDAKVPMLSVRHAQPDGSLFIEMN